MRAGAVRLAPGGAVAAGLMDRHPSDSGAVVVAGTVTVKVPVPAGRSVQRTVSAG